jgi:protein-tyrosine-phosphatase
MRPRMIPLASVIAERSQKTITAVARRLLPARLIKELNTYRAYPKSERALYLRARIQSGLWLPKPKLSSRNQNPLILFVCFGNIMRSPMCEALMDRECAAFTRAPLRVSSAGLHAIPGNEAHPMAIAAARDFGISLDQHRARLLTPALVEQATVIFAMDFQNQVELSSLYPQARRKTFLLSAFAGADHRSAEIADPYYLGAEGTQLCYQTLSVCIQNLARNLSNCPNSDV